MKIRPELKAVRMEDLGRGVFGGLSDPLVFEKFDKFSTEIAKM